MYGRREGDCSLIRSPFAADFIYLFIGFALSSLQVQFTFPFFLKNFSKFLFIFTGRIPMRVSQSSRDFRGNLPAIHVGHIPALDVLKPGHDSAELTRERES